MWTTPPPLPRPQPPAGGAAASPATPATSHSVRVKGRRRRGSTLVVAGLVFMAATMVQLAASAVAPVIASAAPNPVIAYVTNFNSNSVTPIDVATNHPGSSIPVGHGPFAVAITPDDATVYVVNQNDNTVTPIDVASNTAGASIGVGSVPFKIAITRMVKPPTSPTSPATR